TTDVALVVSADPDIPGGEEYVSRGAHKLAGALAAFEPRGLTVAGRRCLDAGASTGGFTDVLLRHGAREVVAVDVGYGPLASPHHRPRARPRRRRRARGIRGRRPVLHLADACPGRAGRRDRRRGRPGADGEAAVRGRPRPGGQRRGRA